jgi:hypothetical protein
MLLSKKKKSNLRIAITKIALSFLLRTYIPFSRLYNNVRKKKNDLLLSYRNFYCCMFHGDNFIGIEQ